jgi:hypothetical protein
VHVAPRELLADDAIDAHRDLVHEPRGQPPHPPRGARS